MVVENQVITERRLNLTYLLQTVKTKISQIIRIFHACVILQFYLKKVKFLMINNACVLFNFSNEKKSKNPDMQVYLQY